MLGQELNWTKQYFTSRGWAWLVFYFCIEMMLWAMDSLCVRLDVNYGGSSGFGRKYMQVSDYLSLYSVLIIFFRGLLASQWGIRDVQDCLLAAKSLSKDFDTARVMIRGGSSGGYTVLAALSFSPENTYYAAATSSYGISNLRLLAEFTHKFELRYMEKLIGGTIEDIPDVYDKDRSPIFNADKIQTPLLVSCPFSILLLLLIFTSTRSYRVRRTRSFHLNNQKSSLRALKTAEERSSLYFSKARGTASEKQKTSKRH
jgi:hypothetical protein